MDAGIGVTLTGSSLLLAATYGITVGLFLLAFTVVVYGQTNEIIIARRLILITRIAIGAFFMCNAIQLSFDARGSDPIEVPDVRVIRPVLGVVLAFLAFFVSSHQVFRWLVVLTQPLFAVSCSFSEARWYTTLECREKGTCLQQGGYSTDDVRLQVRLQLATIAASMWTLMGAAYLLMALGACHSRYPVRLFSCTKPLSQVPSGSSATATKNPVLTAAKGAASKSGGNTGSSARPAGAAAAGQAGRVATSAAASTAIGRVATSSGMKAAGEGARRREGRATTEASPLLPQTPGRPPAASTAAAASPASVPRPPASPAMAAALAARQQALLAAAQAGVLHGGATPLRPRAAAAAAATAGGVPPTAPSAAAAAPSVSRKVA